MVLFYYHVTVYIGLGLRQNVEHALNLSLVGCVYLMFFIIGPSHGSTMEFFIPGCL